MIKRLGISAFFALLPLGLFGFPVTRAGTIMDIVTGGGMLTQGNLKFTFTKDSVSGTGQNGPLTNADINVDAVTGGLTFSPSPMLDLKTQQGNQSLQFTITYTVMPSTGTGGIARANLAFTPGLVENAGTSEVTETFTNPNDMLHVFKTNNNEVFDQNLTQSVSFATPPASLTVTDVARVSLAVAQGNQRTIQLLDLTNTFTVTPEPSTLVLTFTAIPLSLLCWWRTRRHAT